MTDPILITSALPYANGSIHLGHLGVYPDRYLRALSQNDGAGRGVYVR
jgi:methionyl-tRNA synthetase